MLDYKIILLSLQFSYSFENTEVAHVHFSFDVELQRCIVCMGFPGGSAGKVSACNVGDLGLIPELGRSPGKGKGYPLQYSGLENSLDCIVHGVAKSRT